MMITRVSLLGTAPSRTAERRPVRVRLVLYASTSRCSLPSPSQPVTRLTSFWGRCLSSAKLPAAGLAAVITLTSWPSDAGSILANKPALTSDYAAVVRKREGKSKSSLPTSKEAEALLEINEDMFTAEALEGMAR